MPCSFLFWAVQGGVETNTNCATAGYLQQNNGPACNNWNIWDGIFGTEWTERMESWVGFLGAAWCL